MKASILVIRVVRGIADPEYSPKIQEGLGPGGTQPKP
jgi:hypothetical protein